MLLGLFACAPPEAAHRNSAMAQVANTATPAAGPESALAALFNADMLGSRLAYFERIAGPAKTERQGERTYRVGACSIDAQVNDGEIVALRVHVSERCSPELKAVLRNYNLPPANRLTFGEFERAAGPLFFVADCLGLHCGNQEPGTVAGLWTGSRADGSIIVALSVELLNEPAIGAATKWEAAMSRRSEEYLALAKFNDGEYNEAARAAFAQVPITAITVSRSQSEVSEVASGMSSPPASTPPEVSADRFSAAVVGRSMAEVRSIYGTPSNIIQQPSDGLVSWYYWPDRLRVVDSDSGAVAASARVTFSAWSKIAIQASIG